MSEFFLVFSMKQSSWKIAWCFLDFHPSLASLVLAKKNMWIQMTLQTAVPVHGLLQYRILLSQTPIWLQFPQEAWNKSLGGDMYHKDGFIKWYSHSSSAQSYCLSLFLWIPSPPQKKKISPLFSGGGKNPKVIVEILCHE